MSRQLAISAAVSIFMMAAYVLFGGDATRGSLGHDSAQGISPVEISAPALPRISELLPLIR